MTRFSARTLCTERSANDNDQSFLVKHTTTMTTEQTPLISDQDGAPESAKHTAAQDTKKLAKKQTPLPKVQLFLMLLVQCCEPICASCIYPFVVSLVNETGMVHPYYSPLTCCANLDTRGYRWRPGQDRILCGNHCKLPSGDPPQIR